MKKLFFFLILTLGFHFGLSAQTVTFSNSTPHYFVGALHSTTTGSSCGSIVPGSYYYDIPSNYSHTTNSIMDENGTPVTVPSVIGISFQIYPSGPVFTCSFCTGGVQTPVGFTTVTSGGTTVNVFWQLIGGNLTISFF